MPTRAGFTIRHCYTKAGWKELNIAVPLFPTRFKGQSFLAGTTDLDQTLRQHGVGDLDEAGNVGARNIVARDTVLVGS